MSDFKLAGVDRYEFGATECLREAEKYPVGSVEATFWISKAQVFATLMVGAASRAPVQ